MNDYFDYNDYIDYFDYYPKMTVPNPEILDPTCEPNPKPLYAMYIRIF